MSRQCHIVFRDCSFGPITVLRDVLQILHCKHPLCQTMSFDEWANMNKGLEASSFGVKSDHKTGALSTWFLLWFFLNSCESSFFLWELKYLGLRKSTRTSQTLSQGLGCAVLPRLKQFCPSFGRPPYSKIGERPIYDAICAKFVPELCIAVFSVKDLVLRGLCIHGHCWSSSKSIFDRTPRTNCP